MTNETLINLTIPFLKPSDNARLAKEFFIENRLALLPIVEEKHFLGYISEESLLDIAPSKKINSIILSHSEAFIGAEMHYFEAMKLMNLYNLDLVAVVDADDSFRGSILKSDIASYISKLGFTNAPGGILVLSVMNASYSVSEISRIVESNDMKILCFYVEDNPEDGFESYITIKLNKTDLTRLIASFERFDYKIEADFHETSFQPIETERLDMLMRYLSV
ncbi:MAG: CBS domain-containing protein [Cytophagales bacterium]